MLDSILLLIIVVPPLAVHVLGRCLSRNLAGLDAEARAARVYTLSRVSSAAVLAQFAGTFGLCAWWPEDLPRAAAVFDAYIRLIIWLRDLTAPWFATACGVSLCMLLLGLDLVLFGWAWFRLDKLARGHAGSAGRHARRGLRSFLVGAIPMVVWLSLMPQLSFAEPLSFIPALVGFLLLVHGLSPWTIQFAHPTAPLPDDHPAVLATAELARRGGVRIASVRRLGMGDAPVANALVCGIWPGLRRIYLTDPLLAHFSPDEIRAILAHEIGHVAKHHLWYYVGFALAGVLAMPFVIELIVGLLALGDDWLPLLAAGVCLAYWGIVFSFASRRFERQADRYAINIIGDKALFARALTKLSEFNGAVRRHARTDVFQTHPALLRRLADLDQA